MSSELALGCLQLTPDFCLHTEPCPEHLDPAKEQVCAGILQAVYNLGLLGGRYGIPVLSPLTAAEPRNEILLVIRG